MDTNFKLTPEELVRFRRDGYIGPFNLYSPDDAAKRYRTIRAELFNREHAVYDLPPTSPIANYDRHLDVNLLSEHVCRAEIVERVSSILGPDVVCWRSEMFPKYPGDEGTDWHQADTYAHASGKPQVIWPGEEKAGGAITVWTAFTEATEENGCLRFILGTHEHMFYDESKKMEFRPEQINRVERAGEKRGFFGYDLGSHLSRHRPRRGIRQPHLAPTIRRRRGVGRRPLRTQSRRHAKRPWRALPPLAP